jgi:Ca2+-binding RTX toxin-like protein
VNFTRIGNYVYGDNGNDFIYLSSGNSNQLFGGAGDDWLGLNGNFNALSGGSGNDWIGASGTGNTLAGGGGGDTLFAYGSGNYLYSQDDPGGGTWIGVSGSGNFLFGTNGNDYVAASGNNNTLDGGLGNDTLVAGAHAGNRYVFHVGYGQDTISNFARHQAGGTDIIDLNGFGLNFASLQHYLVDGPNVMIRIDAATILTINGVTIPQLQARDFIF